MPLTSGESPNKSIPELHKGPQYKRTKKKIGKKRANKQAIAIALKESRKPYHKPTKRSGKR